MVLAEFLNLWNDDKAPRMLVHTSGSTGKPKPLWVEKHRMEATVINARRACRMLYLKSVNHHIIGFYLNDISLQTAVNDGQTYSSEDDRFINQ